MKCPINHYRSKSCDQDFTPVEFRAHYVNTHESLGFEITMMFMLAEILEKVNNKNG